MQTFSFKQLSFLHCGPLSLSLSAHQSIGLRGASGAGKSQLLRVLADMEPHQGDVILDSVEQHDMKAHAWRQKVALVPAETAWWHDRVGEHFTDLKPELTTQLGFSGDISQWSVSRLSSGEKQRLGLLRALQQKPEVLLLDEPTANLDQQNTDLYEAFVEQYIQQNEACSIWVSHDQEQLDRVCEQNFELSDGALVQC